MHFGVHFPKENVQRTFSKGKCSAYIFQRKMFSCAKMHLMRTFCYTKCYKCIFATHHILRSKMFSITFYFVKCSASHFPKENVQQRTAEHFPKGKCSASLFFAKQKTQHFSAFAVPLHFVGAEHFPLENVQHQQNVRVAPNTFLQSQMLQMYLMPKCILAVQKCI